MSNTNTTVGIYYRRNLEKWLDTDVLFKMHIEDIAFLNIRNGKKNDGYLITRYCNTSVAVKPANKITSIKQSLVFKWHILLVLT